jgi:hypothetical protein
MKQGTLIDASLVPSAVNAPKRPDADLPPDAFGRPLTPAEVHRNQRIVKQRAPIEPLFSLFKNVYGFARARYRGLVRNACAIALAAIAINLKRWARCQPSLS